MSNRKALQWRDGVPGKSRWDSSVRTPGCSVQPATVPRVKHTDCWTMAKASELWATTLTVQPSTPPARAGRINPDSVRNSGRTIYLPDKLVSLKRTIVGVPVSAVDESLESVVSRRLVRRFRPCIQFLSTGSPLCSRLPSDPASRRRSCASLASPPSGCPSGSHLQPAEHARHTTQKGGAVSRSPR